MLVSASTCYVTLLGACVSTEQNTGSQYSPLSHPQAMFVVAALFGLPHFCLCCSFLLHEEFPLYQYFLTCLRTSFEKLSIDCNLHTKIGQNKPKF